MWKRDGSDRPQQSVSSYVRLIAAGGPFEPGPRTPPRMGAAVSKAYAIRSPGPAARASVLIRLEEDASS